MSQPVSGTDIEASELGTEVCIVGGGPMGLSVSIGLTQAGIPHILVESGGIEPGDAQVLAEGRNIGMAMDDPASMRVRALGGTTHIWGGFCCPFAPDDFEKRDWIPNSGWPIVHADFMKWIGPATETLDLGNWWAPDDLDPGYRRRVDPGRGFFDLVTFKYSPVTSGGRTEHKGNFWQFNKHRVGASVVLDTTARQLNFSENGAVASIDCTRADGRPLRVTAKTFVLASGGMETARFLLINRRRNPGPLSAMGTIGQYLMAHHQPVIGRLWLTWALDDKFFGTRARDGSFAFWRFVLNAETKRRLRLGAFSPRLASIHDSRREGEDGRFAVSTVYAEIEHLAMARSRVLISDSETDPLGDPVALVDYFSAPENLRLILEGSALFAREVGLQRIGRMELIYPPLPAKNVDNNSYHHHMGTVRMGNDVSTAVVDSDLKVFGTPNLFISSVGTFPTGGFVNPTMNAIALALRLADHLARRVHT